MSLACIFFTRLWPPDEWTSDNNSTVPEGIYEREIVQGIKPGSSVVCIKLTGRPIIGVKEYDDFDTYTPDQMGCLITEMFNILNAKHGDEFEDVFLATHGRQLGYTADLDDHDITSEDKTFLAHIRQQGKVIRKALIFHHEAGKRTYEFLRARLEREAWRTLDADKFEKSIVEYLDVIFSQRSAAISAEEILAPFATFHMFCARSDRSAHFNQCEEWKEIVESARTRLTGLGTEDFQGLCCDNSLQGELESLRKDLLSRSVTDLMSLSGDERRKIEEQIRRLLSGVTKRDVSTDVGTREVRDRMSAFTHDISNGITYLTSLISRLGADEAGPDQAENVIKYLKTFKHGFIEDKMKVYESIKTELQKGLRADESITTLSDIFNDANSAYRMLVSAVNQGETNDKDLPLIANHGQKVISLLQQVESILRKYQGN